MRALLVVIGLLQWAPTQSEADKLEAALKKVGERTYRIKEGGKESGTLTLRNRIELEGDRKIVVFEDRIAKKIGDLEATLEFTERATLDGLLLLRGSRSGTTSEGKIDWKVLIREGDAFITVDDRKLLIRNVKAAVGEQAVIRLVCAKEQKVGAAFKADVLVLASENLNEDHEFRCVCKETLEVGGRKIDTFKWEEKWEGTTIRGGDVISKVNNSYWVDLEGNLLRFTSGRTEMVLDKK